MNAKPSTRKRRQQAKGKRRSDNSDDPFAGWPPTPVRCRWLSAVDAARAARARVVRLLVDSDRAAYGWANDVYQRHVLRDVTAFLGPMDAVLLTPGGMISTAARELTPDADGLAASLAAINVTLSRLNFPAAPPETLLGFDVCLPCQAVPLQTVVHVPAHRPTVTADNTTVKLYPIGEETETLIGWRMAQAARAVPAELAPARLIRTRAGSVLALVCHDACLFSARSRARLSGRVSIRIREHFEEAAATGPDFTLIANHWQRPPRSGVTFKNAARVLAEEWKTTAVTTLFAARELLEEAARRFPVLGPRKDEVVTLVVEDGA